ncbi:MAG TPA: HAD-IC family P-type ATPase, partial [Thermoanaerobaculia bacterium]|nr:HAD-IC family P-type ATPase [Thermoanaerobaculia bacterium]
MSLVGVRPSRARGRGGDAGGPSLRPRDRQRRPRARHSVRRRAPHARDRGGGAAGRVGEHRVLLGSRALLSREGIANADDGSGSETGESVVALAVDERLVGEILLDDPVRPEAREAIAEIRSLGVTPLLLSGDRASVVEKIAREVGIREALGDLAPGEKPEVLRQRRTRRSGVAMVGDGMNDGPALAAADAGIAFGVSSALARASADAVLLKEDLREVPRLLKQSRRTMRVVRQNLLWAFGYNVVGILL